MTEELTARQVGETVTVPDLAVGDDVLFATATGRVHAARITHPRIDTMTTDSGNVYVLFTGYRIHTTEPRSSFGRQHCFAVRAATLRKF
jgi:hypothetical protein